MKFIHTADAHLNAKLTHTAFTDSAAHEKRLYELRESFLRVIDAARDAGALFIAGDMFDDQYMPLHEMERLFEKLKHLDAEVFILIGNHDGFLHNKAYRSLLSAHNIHTFNKRSPKVSLETMDVYGINTHDFSEAFLKELADGVDPDKANVLLLHGDVERLHDENYLTDVPTLKDLPFDYIALGHIHQHAFLAPHIAYPGNPEPLDFTETEQKGYIEGELDVRGFVRAQFVPSQIRSYHVREISVSKVESESEILDKVKDLPSGLRDGFVRVRLTGEADETMSIDPLQFKSILDDYFHYIEFRDETQAALHLETLKQRYKDTIVEQMIQRFEKQPPKARDEEVLKAALRALLDTEEGAR